MHRKIDKEKRKYESQRNIKKKEYRDKNKGEKNRQVKKNEH